MVSFFVVSEHAIDATGPATFSLIEALKWNPGVSGDDAR
jgi:hypothetical protein